MPVDAIAVALLGLTALLSYAFSRILLDIQQDPMIAGIAARNLTAVQAAHSDTVSRLGGVAVFIGFLVGTVMLGGADRSTAIALCAGGSLVFLSGAAEDIGFNVSPMNRLLAAFCASFATASLFLLGQGHPAEFIHSPEYLLSLAIAVVFAAGMTNAVNLVDGLNGLAVAATLLGCSTLAWHGIQAEAVELAILLLVLAAATAGFGIVNFPGGRIFLGDGGAYLIGFVMAWAGAILILQTPDISPLIVILALFWPTSEITLTILRRFYSGRPLTSADFSHSHQLAYRLVTRQWPAMPKRTANSLATACLFPFMAIPPLTTLACADAPRLLSLSCLVYFALHLCAWLMATALLRRPRQD